MAGSRSPDMCLTREYAALSGHVPQLHEWEFALVMLTYAYHALESLGLTVVFGQ